MRVALLVAVLLTGCAAKQVAPTFAMYSESDQALLVQVTTDKGDREDCEWFWNLFRKSSSQVCYTKHDRAQRWVRVGDDRRVTKVHADGVLDEANTQHACVVDGDEVRCEDQRATVHDGHVAVENGRKIADCSTSFRVFEGDVCLGGDGPLPYRAGRFIYQADGGTPVSLPAEVYAISVDGKTATLVHHDGYAARIVTVALDHGTLRTLRVRDFTFAGRTDVSAYINTIAALTPDGEHALVRREGGCDVVTVETGAFTHDASCGELVGDTGYVTGTALVRFGSGERVDIGPTYGFVLVDLETMIARGPDRLVVIRRADGAVATPALAAIRDRIVLGGRTIAALGARGHLVLIDRETMTARDVAVDPTVHGLIGIAAHADGDTVLLGLPAATVLTVSAATGRQERVPLAPRS